MTIDLDPESHIYRVDGQRKPSVTGIIKAAGLIDSQWFNEAAAWRGSVVHKCCELHCKGTLDPATVDPMAQGYLDAWIAFKKNLGFVPMTIEQFAYTDYGYCGTPDRIGCLGDGTPCIIDIKTGAIQKWCALQLAGYLPFVRIGKAVNYRRYGIQLKPDGRYVMTEYPPEQLQSDWAAFLACLTINNWKRVNNA